MFRQTRDISLNKEPTVEVSYNVHKEMCDKMAQHHILIASAYTGLASGSLFSKADVVRLV